MYEITKTEQPAHLDGLELLHGEPITGKTKAEAMARIEQNFGLKYNGMKWNQFWIELQNRGWTDARFNHALNHFLGNQKFPNWTIADFCSITVPVYNYGWVQQKVKEGWNMKHDIVSYLLPDGTVVYKPNDGITLPFPHPPLLRRKTVHYCRECDEDIICTCNMKDGYCEEWEQHQSTIHGEK